MEKLNKVTWMGLPVYLWVIMAVSVFAGMHVGALGTDFGATLFWLTVVGGIIMGVGNQLPIIKDYLGGGPLLLLLLGSFATWSGWIPDKYVEATNTWMATINFQAFYDWLSSMYPWRISWGRCHGNDSRCPVFWLGYRRYPHDICYANHGRWKCRRCIADEQYI